MLSVMNFYGAAIAVVTGRAAAGCIRAGIAVLDEAGLTGGETVFSGAAFIITIGAGGASL